MRISYAVFCLKKKKYTNIFFVLKKLFYFIFFVNDTATTEIYTYLHPLSLHDALPISLFLFLRQSLREMMHPTKHLLYAFPPKYQFDINFLLSFLLRSLAIAKCLPLSKTRRVISSPIPASDRKSTRLNSSH